MNDRQDVETEVNWFTGMYAAGMYWSMHSHDEDWDDSDAQVMDGLCDGVFDFSPQVDELRLRWRD